MLMFRTHQLPPGCSRDTDTDTAPARTLWVTAVPHSSQRQKKLVNINTLKNDSRQQKGTELQRNLNCTQKQICLRSSFQLDHCAGGAHAERGHPHCSQPFISSKSHIRRILNILNPTSARFSPGDILYYSRLLPRCRVLEMKESLLRSSEIHECIWVLCLGGKACESRLVWMLMLA